MLPQIEFKLLDERASLPVRGHPTDAGLDLAALEYTILDFNQRVLVRTGLSVRIPAGYVGLLVPRSSLSKKGIMLTNSCGILDAPYRGELLISLVYNFQASQEHDTEVAFINPGERIAQILIVPIALPDAIKYTGSDTNWNNTARGTGGFGSTGK